MRAGFSNTQLRKLATPIDQARVQRREVSGKMLSYIEGWFAICEANRIFGYDGWDREMVHFERLYERKTDGFACGYLARVRVRVRAHAVEILREGTGFGSASGEVLGEVHERALKAAETDATKRALATFGGRFGLLLYDKEQGSTAKPAWQVPHPASENHHPPSAPHHQTLSKPGNRFKLAMPDGRTSDGLSAEGFCSGLRQLIEAAQAQAELDGLARFNEDGMNALRAMPELATVRGEHYAAVLERLIAQRRTAIASPITGMRTGRSKTAGGARSEAPMPADVETHVAESGAADRALAYHHVPLPAPALKLHESIPAYPLEAVLRRVYGPRSGEEDGGQTLAIKEDRSDKAEPALQTRISKITARPSIDKSVLVLASDRRIRSKAHLAHVAAKPCVICQEMPCHAHHVTFAQTRGLSQKVSDEFTVPLCVAHHNELHRSGSEIAWWRRQEIDPLVIARALWEESSGESNAGVHESGAQA